MNPETLESNSNVTYDNLTGLRVLHMLTTPFTEFAAYRLGIIDEKGVPKKSAYALHTADEKAAYTYLHRLVFRLKRFIEHLPVDKKNFVNYATAFLLIKECAEKQIEPIDLEHRFLNETATDAECVAFVEDFFNKKKVKPFKLFVEEEGLAPANNIAATPGIATKEGPSIFAPKKVLKRKENETTKINSK